MIPTLNKKGNKNQTNTLAPTRRRQGGKSKQRKPIKATPTTQGASPTQYMFVHTVFLA